MLKALCFSLPSVSVERSLSLLSNELSNSVEVIHYNSADFKPIKPVNYKHRSYPYYKNGYGAENLNSDTSFFQFGGILIDTANSIIDFLISEVTNEQPDFILHSHLAIWGKLLSLKFRIPAFSILTTFVLDREIMIPQFRKHKNDRDSNFSNIIAGRSFQLKLNAIYQRLALQNQSDIWDIYINREELNIAFISDAFQPHKESFVRTFKFVGFPLSKHSDNCVNDKRNIIYISLGTIFNKDLSFYKICINVLRGIEIDAVISIGRNITKADLGDLPDNLRIFEFVDQVEILKNASIFLTRGGMASVHEAINSLTPMIVIPEIPEQMVTAEMIQELGIGIYIRGYEMSTTNLTESIMRLQRDSNYYLQNLQRLKYNVSEGSPTQRAKEIILRSVNNE